MKLIRVIITFCRRLFWAIAVAYMVAWHNVYKEDDKILHQVVSSIEEDEKDEHSSPGDTEEITF